MDIFTAILIKMECFQVTQSKKDIDFFKIKYFRFVSGPEIMFLYPDMKTALRGTFINGTMISTKEAIIVAQRCFDGVKRLRFRLRQNQEIFHFGRPNHLRFNFNPTQCDPYEKKKVFVKSTSDRGEGLFAKTQIQPGDIAAYYAGLIYNSTNYEMFSPNMTQNQV